MSDVANEARDAPGRARRVLPWLAGALAGALLAGSGLLGEQASTERLPPRSEPLDLDRYCQHRYGEDATAYLPEDLGGWSCSVWHNGVWGLEALDLHAACRWQRGPGARLGPRDVAEREIACTL